MKRLRKQPLSGYPHMLRYYTDYIEYLNRRDDGRNEEFELYDYAEARRLENMIAAGGLITSDTDDGNIRLSEEPPWYDEEDNPWYELINKV